jgi:hypothetical protein
MSTDKTRTPPEPLETELLKSAEDLLASPDLLEQAEDLIARLGLCGEDVNRRFIFLAGVGGHLGEPIHGVIHGESAGGKNTLANIPLSLLPPDRVLIVGGLSEQALNYHDGPIEGVLVIEEAEGMKRAEYSVRTAMSAGRASRMTVNKSEGGQLKPETLEVDVTASIITTTTKPSLHAENQTRVFDLWIDEGEEQTRRIVLAEGEKSKDPFTRSGPEEELQLWHTALGLLSPAPVGVPFAGELAERFPTRSIRARRDFPRCLSLIRASALLHQKQREWTDAGAILARIEDYRIVYPIIQAVLEPSMSGLTEIALRIADVHNELASGSSDDWVYRADLQREVHKQDVASINTVHNWCKRYSELGYWEGRLERGRWQHRSLRNAREEPVPIPTPNEITEAINLPTTPRMATGRCIDIGDNKLQQLANERAGDQNGGHVDTPLESELSDTSDWETTVSAIVSASNTYQVADREPSGACVWCGLPRGECGCCTALDPGGC